MDVPIQWQSWLGRHSISSMQVLLSWRLGLAAQRLITIRMQRASGGYYRVTNSRGAEQTPGTNSHSLHAAPRLSACYAMQKSNQVGYFGNDLKLSERPRAS